MKLIKRLAVILTACAAAGSAGCGSESPFAATSVNGSSVVLQGTVLNLVPALAAGFSTLSKGADGTITVTVRDYPEITTEVDSEGRFVLRGLPEGSFTLIFTDAKGVELEPPLTFEAVLPNQELIVSVAIAGSTVTLVEEQRNGIGHAGLEIQGSIDEVPGPDAPDEDGNYLFMIAGYQVLATPGVTAIREGNTRLEGHELEVGDQVHVKGVWVDPEAGTSSADQQVLAHEIKLQDGDADGEKVTICHKSKNTLSIGASAWPAHLAHGDTPGPCS